MKKKTKILFAIAFGLLAVLGASVYATGGALQGRFTTAGNELTVDVSSSTPRTDIVVAGDADVSFSTYRFTTVGEAMVVDKLAIKAKGSITAVTTVTIEYEDSSGATVRSSASTSAGKATFTGLDFYLPMDESVNLMVYGDVNAIGSGSTSGDYVQLVFDKANFRAVGQDTGTVYKTLSFTATSEPNKMYVYATKPTVSLDSSSPSGARTVSSNDTVFIFDIAADSAADLTVDSLRINLTSDADFATTASASARIINADTRSALEAPVNVSFTDSSHASLYWTDDFRIDAGTTLRIEIQVDTSSLLDEDAGVDDPLTFSIDLGTPTSAGGLTWRDGYADVTWLGNVTTSTLTSNVLNY